MAPAAVEAPQITEPVAPKGQTLDRVKRNELVELDLADHYGAPDVYM